MPVSNSVRVRWCGLMVVLGLLLAPISCVSRLERAVPLSPEQRAASLRDDAQRLRFVLQSEHELARRVAIAAVEDLRLLQPLALEHANWRVRRAGAERIEDQVVLARIATTDTARAVRRVALERLQDPVALQVVALQERDPELSRLAVSRLPPAGLREVIARSGRSVDRVEALTRLADPELAQTLLEQDADPEVRRAAAALLPEVMARALLARIEDGQVRSWLVRTLPWNAQQQALLEDADPLLRMAALGTLEDPAGLREQVLTATHADVRAQALRVLADPVLAARVLRQDPDPLPRRVAAGLLQGDDAVLLQALAAETDAATRARLVARLRDPQRLARFAADPDPRLRQEAARRLADPDWAARLVRDPDPGVRTAALAHLQDRALLEQMLELETEPALRRAVAARLGRHARLLELAAGDPSPAFRLFLAEQLMDPQLYAQLARSDPHWYVRWRMLAQLEDAGLLNELASSDPVVEVRARAALRNDNAVPAEALLVASRRPDPARAVVGQGLEDRSVLAARLRQIVRGLDPAIRLDLESVLLDTPYVLHDDPSGEDRDTGEVWVERVSLRASVPTRVLARMQVSGGRAARSEQFLDAYRDARGERVAVRLAEVDVIAFLAQLLAALDRPAPARWDDPWLQAAQETLLLR